MATRELVLQSRSFGVCALGGLATGRRVAAGIAPIAGILVGEGAYGLTLLAGSTPAPYWLLEVVVGLGLVAVVAGRLRAVSAIALCVGLTTIVAGLFYLVYSGDLLSVFSSSLT